MDSPTPASPGTPPPLPPLGGGAPSGGTTPVPMPTPPSLPNSGAATPAPVSAGESVVPPVGPPPAPLPVAAPKPVLPPVAVEPSPAASSEATKPITAPGMPSAPAVTPLIVPPPGSAPKAMDPLHGPADINASSLPPSLTVTGTGVGAKDPALAGGLPGSSLTPPVSPPSIPSLGASMSPASTGAPGLDGAAHSAPAPLGGPTPLPPMPASAPVAAEKHGHGKGAVVILTLAILAFIIGGLVIAASLCVGPKIPFLSERFNCGVATTVPTDNDQGLTTDVVPSPEITR